MSAGFITEREDKKATPSCNDDHHRREKAAQPETMGQTLMDEAGVGEQKPEAPTASIVWEYLAHINLLIVGTHSRHNDFLFVDEAIES